MGSSTKYVVIAVIVTALAIIIGLVASSLKRLNSDEGENENARAYCRSFQLDE